MYVSRAQTVNRETTFSASFHAKREVEGHQYFLFHCYLFQNNKRIGGLSLHIFPFIGAGTLELLGRRSIYSE